MNAHNPPQTTAQAALALAAAGMAIFPCSKEKRPLFKGWREDSTSDIATVIKTWRAHPYALIGVDCGKSGLVIIDLDRHGDGDGISPFHELFGHPEGFGAPIIATPNDGAHIYFKAPEGMTIRNSASKLAGGIDVRGVGGYVIAPGSTLPDGRRWRQGFGPDLAEAFEASKLPVLPQAIIDATLAAQKPEKPREAPQPNNGPQPAGDGSRERSWALAKLSAREKELAQTRAGGRNQALNDAAYSLGRVVARNWLSESEVRAALEAACVANGLWQSDGPAQCRKTIESGLYAGIASPHEDLPERERPKEAAPRAASECFDSETGDNFDPETGEILDEEEAGHGDGNPNAMDWDALVERTREDPGAPFAQDVLKALASLRDNDRYAFETVYAKLKKAGCRVSELEKAMRDQSKRKTADDDDDEPSDIGDEDSNEESRRTGFVTVGGIQRRLTNMGALNARYAILECEGAQSVYVHRSDFMPINDGDLYRRLRREVVHYQTKTGENRYVDAFKFWTTHARQHVYRRVAFTSKPIPGDTLNLFRGFGVVPEVGKCSLILNHIREVICSGNEIDAEAMLDLLAWQIQNIGKPSRIIVILKSEQHQVGKGILLESLILKIYGDSGFATSQIDQVIGRFNSAIRGKVFIFLDEALFHGDRSAADRIKSIATATIMGIEEKGLPIVQCPVGVNLWLATNHEAAAHVEEKDERYWVIDVSEHRFGDVGYFSNLTREIESGGREAFAHFLLSRDVSDFTPWVHVPKNNVAKAAMIRESINPFDARKWLEDCCHSERLIGRKNGSGDDWEPWRQGDRWAFHQLRDAYVEWQKAVKSPVAPKPTPSGSLGEVLGRAGFESYRANNHRGWKLPSADDCLARLVDPG
jgi:hypothetical protein